MAAYRCIPSPFGPLTAAATERGVRVLAFGPPDAERLAAIAHHLGTPATEADHPVLDMLAAELDEYARGERTTFGVPTDTPGTPWQQRVWAALRAIPFGETVSYGQLAARLGNPGGSRAVGLANARNPVPIVIPCHRVVASDGRLHGFAGGLDLKRRLLEHEHSHAGMFAGR